MPILIMKFGIVITNINIKHGFHYRFVLKLGILVRCPYCEIRYSYLFILWIHVALSLLMLLHFLNISRERIMQFVAEILYIYITEMGE